jgi:hypothetical protein
VALRRRNYHVVIDFIERARVLNMDPVLEPVLEENLVEAFVATLCSNLIDGGDGATEVRFFFAEDDAVVLDQEALLAEGGLTVDAGSSTSVLAKEVERQE